MPSQPQEYSADSIKVLKGLEGVRKRPAMYIGSTGKDGLHHLIYEVVDNSIDEALAGHCTRIEVTLNEDGSVSVKDNGRGIPVEKHSEVKKSALEVVMTMLHAGGKFDKKAYIISGGLHGVGVSVVNALSEKLIVQVRRQGKIYEQTYKRGEAQADVKVVGEAKGETGTMVRFWPDPQIFSSIKYDFATLVTRFRELAFLNSGVTIVLKEEKTKKKEEFLFKGGLLAFIQFLNEGRKVLHKPIYFHKSEEDTAVECVIQYNESYNESIHGFVNTINTVEGGTHVIGFKTALTRVINDYGTKNNMLKNGMKLTGDDVREGLTAIINLKLREPQFEGQTKTKLGNSEVKGFVDSVTSSALASFFEENPSIARKIVTKVIEALQAREAAKKAKELVRRKSALSFGNLPGKLTDCSSNDLEESELFIVEGDSAGGSARQARDKETQAILPLRGKILNVEKANPHKVFLN
ncbi:ATP-binding protein, partial [Candidatus Pacearchaeota archaeon]|nr:ATP-binding protein [Candidatus Pacearchaeota archaeon]